ncbi:MAG: phosphatase PAP2 family protein [Desulfuromonadales bacterium]
MYKRFSFVNFCVPCVSLLLAVCLEYTGLDVWLSRLFYDSDRGLWPYKTHWLTEDLLHRGGRFLVITLAILLLCLFAGSLLRPGLKPYRLDLAFVLVAGLSGPAIIGGLKSLTHIYSPWELLIFGGNQPYIRIFDHVPVHAPVGHAFPAGHASGGFAWFGIFFALRRRGIPWHQFSLLLPLLLGFVFGLGQQARGAHFLSHDLVTLAICWLSTVVWMRLLYANTDAPAITALSGLS